MPRHSIGSPALGLEFVELGVEAALGDSLPVTWPDAVVSTTFENGLGVGRMCHGGRLIADFSVGTSERPDVPAVVQGCLTLTTDETWVVWAHKVAIPAGDKFLPLTGGDPYPHDAVAKCRRGARHSAPHPACTCGFHAVSVPVPFFRSGRSGQLEVALSGRILSFDWPYDGVLFRAERQTVIRFSDAPPPPPLPPADPAGRLAALRRRDPRDAGPIRLRLPHTAPPMVELEDDAGYCALGRGLRARPTGAVLVTVP
jgi:hypothetical protein